MNNLILSFTFIHPLPLFLSNVSAYYSYGLFQLNTFSTDMGCNR